MHTRRSEEAEIAIAQTLEHSSYELLPDDIFNYIGRLCTPKFALVLTSKCIYHRSRNDMNGFLLDETTLMHAMDSMYTEDINSWLTSFHTTSDVIFLRLYLTMESCLVFTQPRAWTEDILPRHLLRLLVCKSLNVKRCLHPRLYRIYLHIEDKGLFQRFFVELITSEEITDESCTERISLMYRRLRLVEFEPRGVMHYVHHDDPTEDAVFFEYSLVMAYLNIPRSERIDAKFRGILLRLIYPPSIDHLATKEPESITSILGYLTINLFGDVAWTQIFKLGSLPAGIINWPDLFRPENSSDTSLLAIRLLGSSIHRVKEEWARRMFDIVMSSDSPKRYLSCPGCSPLDYDEVVLVSDITEPPQVVDLAGSLIGMYKTCSMDLPWAKLLLWVRKNWFVWAVFDAKTQLDLLHLAAKEHCLSSLLDLPMKEKFGIKAKTLKRWMNRLKPKDGSPLPDHFENLFLFVADKVTPDYARSIMEGMGCIPTDYAQFCVKVRESEKDYAHLLVE